MRRVAGLSYAKLIEHCLGKAGAWQDQPWEDDVVVKVGSKIFAFVGGPDSGWVGVKSGATRTEADEWLARYPDDALASAYIGRFGWNRLRLDGSIPADELLEAVDTSYAAVVSKLPKKERPVS